MIAKTFQGLEEVLAGELTQLGANDIEIGRRMVSFTGDKRLMYRANFELRTALRILKPIKHFTAKDADQVYEQIKAMNWDEYLTTDKTFAVDSVVFSNEFRHSKFVAYKVKDAIVDYFREKYDKRPSVRIHNPDLSLNIHIAETKCTLSLDSSGESLHRRGYRQEATEAPLNEVLAAGMIMLTGWQGECDLIDPMCGSGTLPIEAALIAHNIAPGVFRKEFAFEKWTDFDADLLASVYNDDSREKDFLHHIYGYDILQQANQIAARNIKAAGLSKTITLAVQPLEDFIHPGGKALIITNPPYGERISTDNLLNLYDTIGRKLKHEFYDNEAWVISYRQECFDHIGLRAAQKIPLFNGSLECEFRKYELFSGKNSEYKQQLNEDGGQSNFERRPERRSDEKTGFRTERKFERRDDRKPFDRDRKPFDRDRKPFNKEDGERPRFGGERRFERRDDSKPAFSRDRKPFERRDGEKPRFGGERKFERRDDSKPGFSRDRKSFDKRGGHASTPKFGRERKFEPRRKDNERDSHE